MKRLSTTAVFQNKCALLLLVLFTSNQIFACDVCSCGSSSSSSFANGISGSFLGLSYNYMHFVFKEGISTNSPEGNDYINSIAITGQYQISERIRINAMVPYRFNYRRNSSHEAIDNSGLGDMSVYGLYSVLANESAHKLRIGAGLKMPTGRFNENSTSANNTSATQLGTGSWDVIFPVQYEYTIKDFSLNFGAVYFVKNKNEATFKFGNQTQLNLGVSYAFSLNDRFILAPLAGINYDSFAATEQYNIKDERTSGFMSNATIGLQFQTEKMIIGINSQLPLKQNLIEKEVHFQQGVSLYTYWRF
ncbi:transporter [Flavicella sediminum]|uniref:transporter n=1 Tax=Flavicella sediminum TaxID=2585141 RepID=UPI00111F7AB3|nr:transporter [Flavicella sediminum]